MCASCKPNHGDQRNHQLVREVCPNVDWTLPDGTILSMPSGSHEYTQSERFCSKCNAWQVCKGIIGALLCPGCNEGW